MAGPGSTFAAVNGALADFYDKDFRGKVSWSHGTLFGMLKKTKGTVSGKSIVIPFRSGVAAAISSNFAKAQALAATTNTAVSQFKPPLTKQYGVAQIDGMLMAAAKAEKTQLFDEWCQQIDGVMDGVTQALSYKVYGDAYGSIGRVAASGVQTLASTRLILANPEDVVKFQKGQKLVLAQSNTAACRTTGTEVEVAGIEDAIKGYVTLTAQLVTTLSDATYGDFIYVSGDRGVGASPTQVCLPGLDAWFPITVPTTTDFASGVDRSTDANMRGTVIDLSTSTLSMEDAWIEAVTQATRFGANPQSMKGFTNNTNYKKLTLCGVAKQRQCENKGPYGIGFKGISLQTDNGDVDIMPDRFCPVQRSYLLEMDSIKLYGVGTAEVPAFLDGDGVGKVLRMTDADAYESRVGFYGSMGCNAPIHNVVLSHATN